MSDTFFKELETEMEPYLDRVHNHYTRGGLGDYPANGGSSLDDDMIELGESFVWYFDKDRNEPVTGEWLESIGFSCTDSGSDFTYHEHEGGLYMAVSSDGADIVLSAVSATRGQIRRLLASFYIPVEIVQ